MKTTTSKRKTHHGTILLIGLMSLFVCSLLLATIVLKTRRVFNTFESDRIVLPNNSKHFSSYATKKSETFLKISLRQKPSGTVVALEHEREYSWPAEKEALMELLKQKIFSAQNYALLSFQKRADISAITIYSEEKVSAALFLNLTSNLVSLGISRIDVVTQKSQNKMISNISKGESKLQ